VTEPVRVVFDGPSSQPWRHHGHYYVTLHRRQS
jgi:hypothetical protein